MAKGEKRSGPRTKEAKERKIEGRANSGEHVRKAADNDATRNVKARGDKGHFIHSPEVEEKSC